MIKNTLILYIAKFFIAQQKYSTAYIECPWGGSLEVSTEETFATKSGLKFRNTVCKAPGTLRSDNNFQTI